MRDLIWLGEGVKFLAIVVDLIAFGLRGMSMKNMAHRYLWKNLFEINKLILCII